MKVLVSQTLQTLCCENVHNLTHFICTVLTTVNTSSSKESHEESDGAILPLYAKVNKEKREPTIIN